MKDLTGVQKLIEEIVTGLIAFVYNTLKTFALLWLRPLKNAVRLNVLADLRKGQQISSTTALFVASALVVGGPNAWNSNGLRETLNFIYGDKWYEIILGVIAVYIALDAFTFVLARMLARRRRLARTVSIVRYTIAASAALFWLVLAIPFESLDPRFLSVGVLGIVFSYLLLLVASAYPLLVVTGCLFKHAHKIRSSLFKPIFLLISIPVVLAGQSLTLFVYSCAIESIQVFMQAPQSSVARIEYAACILRYDGSIAITASLKNYRKSALFIANDQFFAIIGNDKGNWTDVGISVVWEQGGVIGAPLIVAADGNETFMMTGQVDPKSLGWPIADTNSCVISDHIDRRLADYSSEEPGTPNFELRTAFRFVKMPK
ncbi:hypothetical protein GFL38_10605 [Rhizobium leguminosarum bv. viciae]|uniref:hypothetical protein n=1 Tax=Rhizobium ruizarguesonis TaxID=2081791 RepID=UPI00143FA316|nr:hypothetical protein [Rhizobium ruizarguesonis]NKJ72713.1 hypothetical protein [Rhizobium leguminosarum bv. viciae]NKQ80392.1 hypothetical protein [Rhizobium ruizarguesonis]